MSDTISHYVRCPNCNERFLMDTKKASSLQEGGGKQETKCLYCGKNVSIEIPDGYVFEDFSYSMNDIMQFMHKKS